LIYNSASFDYKCDILISNGIKLNPEPSVTRVTITITNTTMSPFAQEPVAVSPYNRLEQIFETIDTIDGAFQDVEKTDRAYYIGNALYMPVENHYLFTGAISPKIFFKYDSQITRGYLYQTSLVRTDKLPAIDIIQLSIQNNYYTCIIKTFWIRIIQRRWKKVFAQRGQVLRMMGSIPSQRHFEIYGKYPENVPTMPRLQGMMSDYLSNDNKYRN
jgi:hypothetical protein